MSDLVREDGINLAQAHERLRGLLGSRYDGEGWGKLLDNVHAEPGEEPRMSIDDAFELAQVPDWDPETHAKQMEEYRNARKSLL